MLVLFKHFFPEIKFSSDGDLSELRDGAELAAEALGKGDIVLHETNDGGIELTTAKVVDPPVFSGAELELLKYAVSFLATHVEDASDELDVEIDEDAVDALAEKLFS